MGYSQTFQGDIPKPSSEIFSNFPGRHSQPSNGSFPNLPVGHSQTFQCDIPKPFQRDIPKPSNETFPNLPRGHSQTFHSNGTFPDLPMGHSQTFHSSGTFPNLPFQWDIPKPSNRPFPNLPTGHSQTFPSSGMFLELPPQQAIPKPSRGTFPTPQPGDQGRSRQAVKPSPGERAHFLICRDKEGLEYFLPPEFLIGACVVLQEPPPGINPG